MEKCYLTLGIGGLMGLSFLEEPFGVFEVVLWLFGGAFVFGMSALIIATGFSESREDGPGWLSICISLGVVYLISPIIYG